MNHINFNHDDPCKPTQANPQYVSEKVPDNPEGETEPERGSRSVITICNGTDTIVYVELHPIEMVRRNIARNKDFGFGVEGAGGVNVKVAIVKMGS